MIRVNKYYSTILRFILPALCILSIVALQKPSLNQEKNLIQENFKRQEKIKKSELNLFRRIPSFGFNNLIADRLFLDFIQYYGDREKRKITGYSMLIDYYELIVKADPRFIKAYFILDPAVSLFSGRPDKSVQLIDYGLRYITSDQPIAYQIWLFKATNELLFLGETQEARKSFEKAAQWAEKENTEDSLSASQIFYQTAQFLADNPDSTKARASAWLMILNNARDDEVRKVALRNLQKLGAEVKIEGNRISISIPDNLDE